MHNGIPQSSIVAKHLITKSSEKFSMIQALFALLLCANSLSAFEHAAFTNFSEQYAGEWAQRDAAITEALDFLPQNSNIRTELMQRRAQVARIWHVKKPLKGVESRVMCILYDKGYGMYEARWYSKPLRPWYSRVTRFLGEMLVGYEFRTLI